MRITDLVQEWTRSFPHKMFPLFRQTCIQPYAQVLHFLKQAIQGGLICDRTGQERIVVLVMVTLKSSNHSDQCWSR
jgi:hypothetical protein